MNHEPPQLIDILLVEDNPRDAELTIRAITQTHPTNPVHVVEDGAAALDYIFCRGVYAHRPPALPPKVILLDLKLPKMSGLQVLKAIKSDERTRSIPVVVVSSSGEAADIGAAYALGANSFVVKPVDFEAFQGAMRNLGLYWLLVNQPAK